jgi:predicted RNA-binding protein YlxR (DUF448 family)
VAGPERTCVGCRTRRPQHDLIRFTERGGRVTLARPGATGRSAYLCPARECLGEALRRRAFARAFRRPVIIDQQTEREFALASEERKAVR